MTSSFVTPGSIIQFVVQVEDIREVVKTIAAILPATEIYEESTYIYVEGVGQSDDSAAHLRLTATDSTRTMTQIVPTANIVLPGAAYIPGKKFRDILALSDGTMKVEVVGTKVNIVSSKGSTWSLSTIPTKRPPRLVEPLESVPRVEVRAKPFCVALALAMPAVATSKARPALTQVQVQDGEVTSSDGAAAHVVKFDSPDELPDFTIPVESITEVIRFARDEESIDIRAGGGRVSFEKSTGEFSIVNLAVDFPDLSKSLLNTSVTNYNSVSTTPKALSDAVKKADLVAAGPLKTISLDFVPGAMTEDGQAWNMQVSAEDEAGNSVAELIPVTLNGKSKIPPIKLDLKRVKNALQACQTDVVFIKYGDDTKTQKNNVLVNDGSGMFRAVLSQIR